MMKKKQLTKLAVLGIISGLLTSPVDASEQRGNSMSPEQIRQLLAKKHECKGPTGCAGLVAEREVPKDKNDGNLGYHLMTEDELLLELNDEGTALYKSLSPEGKKLALLVASARCNLTNECAGLNACATDSNACAGKSNSCKGTGKCAIADKNLAVKLVAQKMAKKRGEALNPK